MRKLRGANARRGGINPVTAILLVMIAVMLVVVSIPAYKNFRYRSQKTGCVQAMKTAKDGLIIEYLTNFDASTAEEAMVTLDEVMPGRADICPAGGTVYLVRGDHDIFVPVCGLHDDDKKLRVRLNASRAKQLLEDALKKQRRISAEEPESVDIVINSLKLTCVRVPEVQDLRRGTKLTNGYKGIVCFYGINGDGTFNMTKLAKGEICYFVYADEYHCASWRADDGWTGDAYKGIQTKGNESL